MLFLFDCFIEFLKSLIFPSEYINPEHVKRVVEEEKEYENKHIIHNNKFGVNSLSSLSSLSSLTNWNHRRLRHERFGIHIR